MASDPALTPVPIKDIYAQPMRDQITVLKHGGDGEETRFICGYLHSDQRFGPLLDALPELALCPHAQWLSYWRRSLTALRLVIRFALENEAGWWKAAVGHLIDEATRPGPEIARCSLGCRSCFSWRLSAGSSGMSVRVTEAGLQD